MTTQPDPNLWQDLALLRGQWEANCAALAPRDAELGRRIREFAPRGTFLVQPGANRLFIGRLAAGVVQVLPNLVTAAGAAEVARKIYPQDQCTEPVLVAGIDQGWLWKAIYALPAAVPGLPGFRPPLYFLARDVEGLWLAMHLHDWQALLADGRVRLFVGADAVAQVEGALLRDDCVPWPRLSVTIDPRLWPAGETIDTLIGRSRGKLEAKARTAMAHVAALDAARPPPRAPGSRLRVLGITSRYTTFLQYSMRDWLAAFRALGHETRLAIEGADYEVLNGPVYARLCAEFRPDLVVMIDHYRREFDGLPQNVPCVMWVQDWLPNITSAKAAANQGPLDYVIGYGRIELTRQYGYPRERFMPAMVGVNEARFAAGELTRDERDRYACDVSFISHASAPADVLVQQQLKQVSNPDVRKLVDTIYQRLRAIYESGGAVSDPQHIGAVIGSAMTDLRLQLAPAGREALTTLFTQQINNALFRHQSLEWVAAMGLDLRLYGKGWEQHPTLARFARGPADNQTELAAIYRASKINLHVTPHGAVHQRVLDGLCAGGFFLIRYRPGDAAGRAYRPLCRWVADNGITSDEQIRARADDRVKQWLAAASAARQWDVFDLGYPFVEELALLADSDDTLAGAALWDEYFDVAFDSRAELEQRVKRYLGDEAARQQVVEAMRRPVLDKLTYTGITRRLLQFVDTDRARSKAAA